ncbi:MAG: glycerol-3-phosphate 1-O-acyltransferase PlsY [Candidatus Eremiobacteraeota bacterium]|nr:glycerol-3-phosphate 1-O-acyltransferase PlsY [Candidatus Eremiobacteraeota bacterium]
MTLAAIAVLAIAAGFFIGSIPFGYLVGRFFFGIDIRTHGSGNIGAANALRTLGKPGAGLVLLLDLLKGLLPVLAARLLHVRPEITAGVAAAAVCGHCISPWLRWRGGKGVATSLGSIIALSWQAGAICVGGWFVGAVLTAFSSVGSILANVLAPFALWFTTHQPAFAAYGVFAALLILYTHRENIARIRAGTENALAFLRPWRRRPQTRAPKSAMRIERGL